MTRIRVPFAAILAGSAALYGPAFAQTDGINLILNQPPTPELLQSLGAYGSVLDVIPEISGVTLKAQVSQLAALQALPFVAAADADTECDLARADGLTVPDLSAGANQWSLDAINVTDVGGGRVVSYDGAGVYVAIIDTGLPFNWRAYFPEQRIASQFARAFTGGGGTAHTISSQPDKWEHDTDGHGTTLASVLLGFAYWGPEALPRYFNGVAPRATLIPIKVSANGAGNENRHWESLIAHGIVYAANLKASGALAGAPLVISLSSGLHVPLPFERAAIDYALARGVIVVAAAGNEADQGMRYPAAYPEVISVGAAGWTGQFPADDSTGIDWILRDVPESTSQIYIAPFSSRALPGQSIDVVAPGFPIACAWTGPGMGVDYTFSEGTSQAAPHVAGTAALMLQKNPNLDQAGVRAILRATAAPLAQPACVTVRWPGVGPGNPPSWSDLSNIYFFNLGTCWDSSATGAGLVQADAALAATPNP
jgi:subtilisin family serine protease